MEMHFEKSLKAINIFQFYFCSVISEHKIIYARKKKSHLLKFFSSNLSLKAFI